MTAFDLNGIEDKRLKEMQAAFKILYGDKTKYRTIFSFEPTGIGSSVTVTFVLSDGHRIEKNITDISNW
jgi:hypothetical protein